MAIAGLMADDWTSAVRVGYLDRDMARAGLYQLIPVGLGLCVPRC